VLQICENDMGLLQDCDAMWVGMRKGHVFLGLKLLNCSVRVCVILGSCLTSLGGLGGAGFRICIEGEYDNLVVAY
jgi:hypothetical protein